MKNLSYPKIAAVLVAFLVFSRLSSASSNSAHALEEAKAAREGITALREDLGFGEAEESHEAETDEHATPAAAKKATTTTAAAKKTTATTKASATGAHGAPSTSGSSGAAHGAASTSGSSGAAHATIHWTYAGATGPSAWGTLDAANAACLDGSAQSPIDISAAKPSDLADLGFTYAPLTASVVNNGHTIQVDVAAGDSVRIGTTTYALAQFHFHGPSEHTVNGKTFPLEVHFVHKDASGKLAVVGVLVAEGEANPAFDSILAHLPTEENKAQQLTAPIDPQAMLPTISATYRYAGSLTTPPCSEGVAWNVMAQPITMSRAQIAAVTAKFAEPNNRPVQKLAGRELVLDVTASIN